MKSLARLSVAAIAVAFGEVMLGSWTRINGAGMTCPDYPLCRGRLVPALGGGTTWEWTHRVLALLLCALVLALAIVAWRKRKDAAFILPMAALVVALFGLQVFLGAITVHLANTPMSVVWHWGAAMAFAASLAATAIFSSAGSARVPDSRLGAVLVATAGIAFVTMCIGAYVSSSGAGLACTSIPGCAGNVVVYTPGQSVQMLHRLAAALCLLSAVGAVVLAWAWRASGRVLGAASLGLALVFVQVFLGLMNVVFRLPMDLREAHAANAALVFLAFVCAAALAAAQDRAAERVPAR